jgi:chemotaxis protein CheD
LGTPKASLASGITSKAFSPAFTGANKHMPPPTANWVIPPPKKSLVVGVADLVASNDSSSDLVTYSLGSCLGIVAFDPSVKVGGLLHIMLPDSSIDPVKATLSPNMFVDTGMVQLLQAVGHLGAKIPRLIFKAAGGAQFLDEKRLFNIGDRNTSALKKFFNHQGFALQSLDHGGKQSRTMRLELATGRVTIHTPGNPPYPI